MRANLFMRITAVAALATVTNATPVLAQSGGSGSGSASDSSGQTMSEPAGADNRPNFSWLGLFGLLGLMGLKRRSETHDDVPRTART